MDFSWETETRSLFCSLRERQGHPGSVGEGWGPQSGEGGVGTRTWSHRELDANPSWPQFVPLQLFLPRKGCLEAPWRRSDLDL